MSTRLREGSFTACTGKSFRSSMGFGVWLMMFLRRKRNGRNPKRHTSAFAKLRFNAFIRLSITLTKMINDDLLIDLILMGISLTWWNRYDNMLQRWRLQGQG